MLFNAGLLLFGICCFFAGVQIFYFLFFFLRLARYRSPLPNLQPEEKVSLIICAFNEEANLRKNLPLWLSQQYHVGDKACYEVLVVNDNSEDNTLYYLNEMELQYPHLHVLHLTQKAKLIPGKKFALSMGIKSARYETLLLTDADCSPASNTWLSTMVAQMQGSAKIVLGYGAYHKLPGELNRRIRFETAHSAIQYLSCAMAGMPYMGVGRNLAYKRELFIKQKGFSSHHHIVSGDDDLFINQVANKRNTTVCIDPRAFTYSDPKRTAEAWAYQKKRHLGTGKYYKTRDKIVLGTYAFSHAAFWTSFAVLLFFTPYNLYALGILLIRWLLYGLVFNSCLQKLQEQDLRSRLLLYDLWWLWYNIRNLGSIFFKTHSHWK